jgi:hypothetical protein
MEYNSWPGSGSEQENTEMSSNNNGYSVASNASSVYSNAEEENSVANAATNSGNEVDMTDAAAPEAPISRFEPSFRSVHGFTPPLHTLFSYYPVYVYYSGIGDSGLATLHTLVPADRVSAATPDNPAFVDSVRYIVSHLQDEDAEFANTNANVNNYVNANYRRPGATPRPLNVGRNTRRQFCEDLNQRMVYKALIQSPLVFVFGHPDNIVAFATFIPKTIEIDDESVDIPYIEFVCGYGESTFAEKYVRNPAAFLIYLILSYSKLMGETHVYLDSVPDFEYYYERMGFVYHEVYEPEGDLVPMRYDLSRLPEMNRRQFAAPNAFGGGRGSGRGGSPRAAAKKRHARNTRRRGRGHGRGRKSRRIHRR